ncbi:DNA-binding response regulator, OmpR family, contains REC and winged-helix (wHTH) domain [Caloranaerobacter azorensis DSM 13643]|uniref:DNA-binding response regulator, OmpR family, contains REC and winged-helix (WHTH) domain n=1 Tax=Caloranaerobacter azorensis DSM 13643 TaxID=1121264 RepID=A0A1M5VC71_9FIRM|nr:response regulator transcription factor [Caloranaerobacter azorensis]SHH72796.1 DNA-binding response regulator, OmpR family, contains REC and winged-helix (wHTH) domain [Caloranaerobacter azorensis DSM 13643]
MKPNKKNILLVDDEEQIINVVRAYLEKEGYNVFTAYNGKEALDVFNKESIDFIVLDLMLPDLPGEEVCKKIRIKSEVPILMLTAKVDETDRINGLDIGADDYMIKPFSPKELVARVRAIFRRTSKELVKADVIEFNDGDLIIDINKMEVKKRGKLIKLTPKEFKLLTVLAKNLGKVFTREELIDKVLGYDYEGYDRTIDAHIKNLRHKIEDEENKYIVTVYGVGYKFLED